MRGRRLGARTADRMLHAAGLAVTLGCAAVLGALLVDVLADGFGGLAWRLPPGLASALLGSVWMAGLAAGLAVPIGVGAGICLEEYADFAPRGRLARIVEINVASLAGVPAVVYGLLGLALFVRAATPGGRLAAGAATLALFVLPAVVLSTRAALRAVPAALRDASYALGASRWQTLRRQVLPAALPGILAGALLAVSRALGAAAPLLALGALAAPPASLPALPTRIFDALARPDGEPLQGAAAAIIVLLALALLPSGLAAWVRDRWRVAGSW